MTSALAFWVEPAARCSTYEVHYHPPAYPDACHPFTCRHAPEFRLQHNVEIVERRRGGYQRNTIEIDHAVCLACGRMLPCTVGGNVLVALQLLWQKFGRHPGFGGRILLLRARWSRLATYLFDDRGWNGRHRALAELIDKNLTMKLALPPVRGRRTRASRFARRTQPACFWRGEVRLGAIRFDQSYLREAAA